MRKTKSLIYAFALSFSLAFVLLPRPYYNIIIWLAPYLGMDIHPTIALMFLLLGDIMDVIFIYIVVALIVGYIVRTVKGSLLVGALTYILLFILEVMLLIETVKMLQTFMGDILSFPPPPPQASVTEIIQLPIFREGYDIVSEHGFTENFVELLIPLIAEKIVIHLLLMTILPAVFAAIFSFFMPVKKKKTEEKKEEKKLLITLFFILFIIAALQPLFVFNMTKQPIKREIIPKSNDDYFEAMTVWATHQGEAVFAGAVYDTSLPIVLNESVIFGLYHFDGDPFAAQVAFKHAIGAEVPVALLPRSAGFFYSENISYSEARRIAEDIQNLLTLQHYHIKMSIFLPLDDEKYFALFEEEKEGETETFLADNLNSLAQIYHGLADKLSSLDFSKYDVNATLSFTGILQGNKITMRVAVKTKIFTGPGSHIVSTSLFADPPFQQSEKSDNLTIFIRVPEDAVIIASSPGGIVYENYVVWVFPYLNNHLNVTYLYSHPLNTYVKKEIFGDVKYGSKIQVKVILCNNDTRDMINVTIDDTITALYYGLPTDTCSKYTSTLPPGNYLILQYELPIDTDGIYLMPQAKIEYMYYNGSDYVLFDEYTNIIWLEIPTFSITEIAAYYIPGGIFTVVGIIIIVVLLELRNLLKRVIPEKKEVLEIPKA